MLKTSHGILLEVKQAARKITFVASSEEEPDCQGDTVVLTGLDQTEYRRRGMPLHLDHNPPAVVGRCTRLSVEALPGGTGNRLLGEALLLPEGQSEIADRAWNEIRFGARTGVSISFFIPDPERSIRRGPGDGRIITQSLLVEVSLVSLPCCAACQITSAREEESAAAKRADAGLNDLAREAKALADEMAWDLVSSTAKEMAGAMARHAHEQRCDDASRAFHRLESLCRRYGLIE